MDKRTLSERDMCTKFIARTISLSALARHSRHAPGSKNRGFAKPALYTEDLASEARGRWHEKCMLVGIIDGAHTEFHHQARHDLPL
jgi:hypothetical protein